MSKPRSGRATFRRHAMPAAFSLAAAWLAMPATARAQSDTMACQEAAAEAEREWSLPTGMLAAIGRVESGRAMPHGGSLAWPWTINAAGRGHHFTSKQEAIFTVTRLQAQGTRSIDVGCFQINLTYHPGAFASLDEAFDPRHNARYAARFLTDLYQRSGSWTDAIGAYHSASAGKGSAYRARVLAAWRAAPSAIAAASVSAPAPAAAPALQLPTVQAGLPPSPAGAKSSAKPGDKAVVWQIAAQSMGMRVWTAAPPARDPFASAFPPVRPLVVATR